MESTEIERRNAEVLDEIETLTKLIGIAAIARKTETLISERDEMVRVEALDVGRSVPGPVEDDVRAAAGAAGLVGELPRQDRGAGPVPAHNGLDEAPVLGLRRGVGVPGRLAAAKGPDVGGVPAVVVPVVHEGDDELDATLLGGLDDVVEALETGGSRVDGRAGGGQVLEPDLVPAGDGRDVVEAPDAEDLEAGLLDVVHCKVDVGVRDAADGAPVAVGASEVLGHAVKAEACAARGDVGAGRRVAGARRGLSAGGRCGRSRASRGRDSGGSAGDTLRVPLMTVLANITRNASRRTGPVATAALSPGGLLSGGRASEGEETSNEGLHFVTMVVGSTGSDSIDRSPPPKASLL